MESLLLGCPLPRSSLSAAPLWRHALSSREVLLACSCWKLGAVAQECWVSWHVTLSPRCQIPEPWLGQMIEERGQILDSDELCLGRPGSNSISCLRLPSQGFVVAISHSSTPSWGGDSSSQNLHPLSRALLSRKITAWQACGTKLGEPYLISIASSNPASPPLTPPPILLLCPLPCPVASSMVSKLASAFSLENLSLCGGVNLLAPHGVPSPLAWQGALSFNFSLFSALLVDGPFRS